MKKKSLSGPLTGKTRLLILGSILLALFLGALDALVMSAAMPTIIADLGGMHLYSWVYTIYMLARAVCLPLFGKLADIYSTRRLIAGAIALFTASSAMAGLAESMSFLIVARVFQGIGAGGNFALVYIVLTEIAPSGQRGRYLSLGSFIWGLASISGPTLGGLIVTWFSWRWIFFMNVPLGVLAILGIARFYVESRSKRQKVSIDFAGMATLSTAILALLIFFMLGGRTFAWISPPMLVLAALAMAALVGFLWAENRAQEPVLPLAFFADAAFSRGNAAVFCSSFAIFALFAYAPLYIQGALGQTPLQVGLAMLALSLGWSTGSLALGQYIDRMGRKRSAVIGSILLITGCGGTLTFSAHTRVATAFAWFLLAGMGMGFVTLSTLLKVQSTVSQADLGVATGSHQFARTLGGTVGVGVCGGLVISRLTGAVDALKQAGALDALPQEQLSHIRSNLESLFSPEIHNQLPHAVQLQLQTAVADGMTWSFVLITAVAVVCLAVCISLPGGKGHKTA